MADPRHLPNAPITEAIIDFRVKAHNAIEPESFVELADELSVQFPLREERRFVRSKVEFERGQPKQPQVEATGLQGLFLKTTDAKSIVQLRVDGCTFNRLQPYSSWAEIFPAAWSVWRSYVDFARPQLVTRLAVRFINHIRFPADIDEFDDYLVSAPKLPDGVPHFLSGFFTQVAIHDPDRGVAATVRQSMEVDLRGAATLLLDVDAFKDAQLDPSDVQVEEIFEALHEYKNKVFFGSLTERSLELFQ